MGSEILPYLGLRAAITALFWVADRAEAPRMAAFGAASAGAAALSLMLFIPPDARWLGLCDALSLAHVQALALGGAGRSRTACRLGSRGWNGGSQSGLGPALGPGKGE